MIVATVDKIFGLTVPGFGFLISAALVTIIGFFVSTIFARGAARLIDSLFSRMPIVKMIYSAIKDLVNAFAGEKKRFNKPVFVNILPVSTVNPKTAFQFNSCRHVGSKSSTAAPLQAVIYPASLHVFIPDDWLLSDPNPALERF